MVAREFRPPLSTSPSGRVFISKFKAADQDAATQLVDALVLMNEADVAGEIRKQIELIVKTRRGARKSAAIYVEREFAERAIFKSQKVRARDGVMRMRATGLRGPPAVSPIRGHMRVGSEGSGASVVSGSVSKHRRVLMNHPGPDKLRQRKAGLIVIVTDFIGSGTRVSKILDKFMAVPSVRSWRAHRWVNFAVVAAAATREGIALVERHGSRPKVHPGVIAPAFATYHDQAAAADWEAMTHQYGPRSARGAGPKGYLNGGALIVFSYRAPNNVPLFLTTKGARWKPLFDGPIADDMRPAFGLKPVDQRVAESSIAIDANLAADLLAQELQTAVVLKAVHGRWRDGQEIEIAERTGLTVSEVTETHERAVRIGLLTPQGRLTDAGQNLAEASRRQERRRPTIPTGANPYYPVALRAPR